MSVVVATLVGGVEGNREIVTSVGNDDTPTEGSIDLVSALVGASVGKSEGSTETVSVLVGNVVGDSDGTTEIVGSFVGDDD